MAGDRGGPSPSTFQQLVVWGDCSIVAKDQVSGAGTVRYSAADNLGRRRMILGYDGFNVSMLTVGASFFIGGTAIIDESSLALAWIFSPTGPQFVPVTDGVGTIGNLQTPQRPQAVHASGPMTTGRVVPAYGPNITIANNLGSIFILTPTDGVAFTFLAPGLAPIPAQNSTQRITITIRNTFGVLGVATFTGGAGGYRLGAAWVQPANGFNRSITFESDGTNWTEVSRTAVDVAN